jgi:two-component system, OmpR family, KDP operon response regulator KdpE
MSRRILVVEDDPEFAGLLALWLERAGASPRIAATGTEAMRAVYDDRPDLVTLDVGVPHLDGWQLCARIREASTVPIMIVSAHGSETDRIRGLQLGADDYITKPFSFREFVARVEAVLRRAAMPPARGGPEVVRHGGLLIDIGGHRVVVGDHEVHLTPIEFRVLASLARKQGALVSHGQLLHDAWGPEYRDELPLLRTAIRGLRTKLADASGERDYIGTEYGLGYRLAPAGAEAAG